MPVSSAGPEPLNHCLPNRGQFKANGVVSSRVLKMGRSEFATGLASFPNESVRAEPTMRVIGRERLAELMEREEDYGVLLTAFHNMALGCPETTAEDIDHHEQAFRRAVRGLAGTT